MIKKRFYSVILTVLMVSMLFTGCSKSKNTDSNSTGGTSADSSSAGGGSKVKLTALISKHSLTKDLKEMKWLKDLEEKCGVEVEWQQISADWDTKKSAMFASGNIPDLLFNATGDSDYVQYKGLFENLSPLIESYAPNLQEMFTDKPEIKQLASEMDGEIYATPRYKCVWPSTTCTMFINKKWLDNLGLEIPATFDELEKVLLAFKEQDANGNGDTTDEIPMDFQGYENGGAFSPRVLLGSYGVQLTDDADCGYFVEDGVVKNYYTDDRYKELTIFIQKLWQEGLINPEVFTQDYSKYQSVARGDGDVAKVGFTFGWETGDRVGVKLKDQYAVVPPLKVTADSTVDVRWNNDTYAENYSRNAIAMSSACKNKEAAMKFIDGFYDKLVSMQVMFGGMNEVDKGISDNDDGTYTVLAPADTSLDPGSWKWTNSIADFGPYYIREDIKNSLTLSSDMEAAVNEKSNYTAFSKLDEKKNAYHSAFMKYSVDDISTLAINQANVNNIVQQTIASWITDGSDINSAWAAYVDQVNKAGQSQNTEIRQKAYENYVATLK
ncbi:extracellular solute-binding protein [Anaerocolumna sp. MB42-C2]|uniref:extracellular solute-binding protein n=1 Tax=Anaerocolumna sp. MB42-C2 TaxID=3070997 RepID=UPI0027E0C718|nr:extracellular solute-binding protein [Anaerocolumna sp. MB42-C2]WMJ87191.1 extracellular solute-binding protein [Anaerocolumna sp. MB42-C2]